MQHIDAANIACGYHAGDPSIMLRMVRLATKHGVKAGAHPGLPGKFVSDDIEGLVLIFY